MKLKALSSSINWIVEPVSDILDTIVLGETCGVRCGTMRCVDPLCQGGFCFGQTSGD